MFRRGRNAPQQVMTLQSVIFYCCDVLRVFAMHLIILEHSTQYFMIHHSSSDLAEIITTEPLLAHASYGHSWLLFLSGVFFTLKVHRMGISSFRQALIYIKQRFIRLWPMVALAHLFPIMSKTRPKLTTFQYIQQLFFFQNTFPLHLQLHPPSWCLSVDFQLHILGLIFILLGQKFSIKPSMKHFLAMLYIAFIERVMSYILSGCSFYFPPSAEYSHLSYFLQFEEWQVILEKLLHEKIPYVFNLKMLQDNLCSFEHIYMRSTVWIFPFVLGTFGGNTMIQELKSERPSFPWLIQTRFLSIINVILLLDCLRCWHVSSPKYFWRDHQISSIYIAIIMYQFCWSRTHKIEGCLLKFFRGIIRWISKLTYVSYMFHASIYRSWSISANPLSTTTENHLLFILVVAPILLIGLIPIHYLIERPCMKLYNGRRRSYQIDILPSKQKA